MLLGIIVGIVVFLILTWAYSENTLPETIITLMLLAGVVSCHQSDYWQQHIRESDAQEAAAARAAATPHVIREVDGCKVYEFKAGDKYHYFTRCPSTTTTERNYSEPCGKNKTCQRQEVIVTENAK